MTTRPYELLARFGNDGLVAGVSTRTITTINGKDYEGEPTPLSGASDPAFASFAQQFSASAVAENDTLKTANTQLTADLTAKTTAYDAEVVKVTALTAENDNQLATIATLTSDKNAFLTEKASLQTQIATLNSSVTSLNAQVAELQPWNKRCIDAKKFIARFTGPQAQKVYTSIDPVLIDGRKLLNSYLEDNYQVILDDEQVTGLTGYMVMVGILTNEERIEILRDSSSDERYQPTAL